MKFYKYRKNVIRPKVADDLREAAQLELVHQDALRKDLDELYAHVGCFAARRMLALPNDPRITYHSKVQTAPTAGPESPTT